VLEENRPVGIDPRGEIKGRTRQMVAYTKDSFHTLEAMTCGSGSDIHSKKNPNGTSEVESAA